MGNRTLRWKLIPSPSQWVSASATSRFSFMDRRGSTEIRKVDACVEEFNRLSTLPQTADGGFVAGGRGPDGGN